MVMLIVGTGIGGGMILDGRLYDGSDGLAGAAGARMLTRIRRAVRDHAQPVAARRVRILSARLGVDAGLIGAARAVFAANETEGRT